LSAGQTALPVQIDGPTLDRIRHSDQSVTVLDVRESWEYAICAIPGSINVPLSTLPHNLNRLSADGPLVVLCHHGMRSMQAVAWLRQNGFENATNLQGGIDAWARQVDTSMATY
jgi:rhodanese-related sulfurtransferase